MELNTYQRYLVEEFADDYHEEHLDRRDLLKKVLAVTGSIPVAAAVLTSLGCGSPATQAKTTASPAVATATATPARPTPAPTNVTRAGATVLPTDPAIEVSDVKFKGPASDILVYLARPKGNGPFPGVIVIHENAGLTEHNRDIARRFAKEGFAAFAIDLVSRFGGTKTESNENTGFLGRANPDDLVADLVSTVGYMKTQPFVKPSALGVVGFCFGGGYAWETAIASPDIKAAVPFYGPVRLVDKVSTTNAAVLGMYASNDTRITGTIPAVEEKMKAAGKTYEAKVFQGANHGFFNDTRATTWSEAAASEAWPLTLSWLRKYLV